MPYGLALQSNPTYPTFMSIIKFNYELRPKLNKNELNY